MGFGGISIWQLLIILVIVVMIFGTKKLRNMGGDLGTAVKGFKKSVKEEPADKESSGETDAIEGSSGEEELRDAEDDSTESIDDTPKNQDKT